MSVLNPGREKGFPMGDAPDFTTEPELPPVIPGKHREFSFDCRCAVVRYYDSLPSDGSKGAYLRRNRLYARTITRWRKAMHEGITQDNKPGRKALDASAREVRDLRAQVAQLTDDLARAQAVIEVQKKVSALLEMHSGQKERTS